MTTLPSIDPATGQVFAETLVTPIEEVADRVRLARVAQRAWAARPFRERRAVIARFQALLFAHRAEAAALITRENGKPLAESLVTELAVTLDLARYYLQHAERLLEPRRVRHGNIGLWGKRGWIYHDPLGVIAIISPWNYPMLLPFGEMIPALIAGNAVLLKPSEFTVRTACFGVDLLHQAGVPPDLCRVLVGGGDVGAALVEARPDKVFFTGSSRTGRKVAVAAAERLIPVSLELGGSDPCVVLADADIDRAVSGAIWARFSNGGQTCVAAKRAIVERPVYDRFVERLVQQVIGLRVGPGSAPGVEIGPLIREAQVEELERQLRETVAQGARVLTGGHRLPAIGPTFFQPTVVTDVPLGSPLWREEVFGPVLPVVAADDVEQAVRIANDSSFGLAASIWTGNRARGERLARCIEAGAVLVNDATFHVGAAEVPHGGEKESGVGRTHGEYGLYETCRVRFVGSDLLDRIRKPWWFGYEEDGMAHRDAFLRFAFAPSLWQRLKAAPGALRMMRNRRPL